VANRHLDALDALFAEQDAIERGDDPSYCWATSCGEWVPATSRTGLCSEHFDEFHG
jgi:hypothetical protein